MIAQTVTRHEFPTLESDVETDVLIIGGGIAGILTAYFLQQNDVPYVLVVQKSERVELCLVLKADCSHSVDWQGQVFCKHGVIADL